MHSQVRWIFMWQGRVMLIALLAAGVAGGLHAGVSALMGGGIGILGGAAYVWRAMRSGGDFRQAYRGQLLGEVYKLAVSIVMFAVVFIGYRELVPLPLFVTYVLTLTVYWAALLRKN